MTGSKRLGTCNDYVASQRYLSRRDPGDDKTDGDEPVCILLLGEGASAHCADSAQVYRDEREASRIAASSARKTLL